MIAQMLMVWCLSANPTACSEINADPTGANQIDLVACEMDGPVLAQRWAEANPLEARGRVFKGWRCRIGAPQEDPA